MATDWDFYGNFQFDTASQNISKEANPINTAYDDTNSIWGDTGISRFGGKVTKGDIFGNAELNSAGAFRHLYGEWNFGSGKLLIGQTWDLTFQGGSLQNMGGGISTEFGTSAVRVNQIRLTFGDLQIAACSPVANNVGGAGTAGDVDPTLPKMEVRYTFATDMFSVQPLVAWQSVDYATGVADQTTDLTSMMWAVLGKVNFGPAYVNARVWGGSNTGDLGLNTWITDSGQFNATTLKFDDVTTLCYGGVVGFKASDMITVEGGYSAIDSEVTQNGVKTEWTGGNEYYILASITLAPGVVLQPEYFKEGYGDVKTPATTTKMGETTYIGANWVISF
jgi:hypothetical protein